MRVHESRKGIVSASIWRPHRFTRRTVARRSQRVAGMRARSQTPRIAKILQATRRSGGWCGPLANQPYGLLAGHFYRRRARNHPARNLRCDQECHNDGWQAYQSEKLIHRKHSYRPPGLPQKASSIRPLRGLLIAGQKLVCVGRPGNREQRQNRNYGQRFHGPIVVFDCGQKRQSLAHFLDEQEKHRGRNTTLPSDTDAAKRAGAPVRADCQLARFLRNTSVNRSGLVCGGINPRYSPLRPIR